VVSANPATTRTDHLDDNLASRRGSIPDLALRKRMLEAFVAG
jgi:hypothetical protein